MFYALTVQLLDDGVSSYDYEIVGAKTIPI